MQYSLIAVTLAQPIERLRGGGKIPVAVNATYMPDTVPASPIVSLGLAFSDSDEPAAILKAREEAIEDSRSQFEKLSGVTVGGGKPVDERTTKILTTTIREKIASPGAVEAIKAKRAAGDEETANKLELPAPEHHQQKLLEMCEAIGMEPLMILGQDGTEPWTAGEVIALSIYFEGLLKRFEATDEAKRAY